MDRQIVRIGRDADGIHHARPVSGFPRSSPLPCDALNLIADRAFDTALTFRLSVFLNPCPDCLAAVIGQPPQSDLKETPPHG